MNKIVCTNNETTIQVLLDKLKDLNLCCEFLSGCCTTLHEGAVMRAVLIGDKVYMTDDGTKPVFVPFVNGNPIETYLMSVEMDMIYFNGVAISQMYLNGDIVFYRSLVLELPQYSDNTIINLAAFIASKNPDNIRKIIVHNGHTQPTLRTYSLAGLEVTLINDGEFQGTSPSSDAFIINSPLVLINNGWIRGAGGNGIDGKDAPDVLGWVHSEYLYDGSWSWACGQPGCPAHYMQFPTGVAFLQSSVDGSMKQIWRGGGFEGHISNTGPFTVFGQTGWFRGARKRTNMIGQCGHRFDWYGLERKIWDTLPSGSGGTKGIGQNFNQTSSTAGTSGTTIDGSTGTSGTNGGDWGNDGVGTGAGKGGDAIIGSRHLVTPDSNIGNQIGGIIW